jgi:hypothetical protein
VLGDLGFWPLYVAAVRPEAHIQRSSYAPARWLVVSRAQPCASRKQLFIHKKDERKEHARMHNLTQYRVELEDDVDPIRLLAT